jgi:hypothetical protein
MAYTPCLSRSLARIQVGYDSSQNSVTNFVYIMSGVISGVSMGYLASDKSKHSRVLKQLFVLSTVCLGTLTILSTLKTQGVEIGARLVMFCLAPSFLSADQCLVSSSGTQACRMPSSGRF